MTTNAEHEAISVPVGPRAGTRFDQSKHKALIAKIVAENPGTETKRFWAAIRSLSDNLFDWPVTKQPFLPDAFRIDRENCIVEIHEAVNSHPPSERALLSMGLLWFELDCIWQDGADAPWTLHLLLHRADNIEPTEIDLKDWYYRFLATKRSIAA